ncbi:unnamed protein product [Miscanthus lutarioriparius]|uniref:Uncharacterized protein n=1 Tax=Miscanthus lutarioriparius TaxID=422564 RepID=A0A811RSJ3_9POAL|nr:unnamed protein product [Miscanthus lutarioriparius]
MARNKIMPRNLHTGKNSTIKQFDILRKSCPGEDSSVQELCPGACNIRGYRMKNMEAVTYRNTVEEMALPKMRITRMRH